MHHKLFGGLSNSINDLNTQLQLLNHNLSQKNFWDSQMAAALIGAFFALLTEYLLRYAIKRKEYMENLYADLVKKNYRFSPKSIASEARITKYEKDLPLNERMVIELKKRMNHYGRIRSFILKRKFKKYENSLLEIGNVEYNSKAYHEGMSKATQKFEDIQGYLFKKTEENEYTLN